MLDLHIGGKVIQTTAEHPFYVRNFGWLPAGELKASDELSTSDGSWVKVDAIHSIGKWATDYNLRVAQHHTYFVGKNDWGFDVWAHNAYEVQSRYWASSASGTRLRSAAREFRGMHPDGLNRSRNVATADAIINGRQRTVRFINDRHGMHSEQRLIAWHELQKQRGRQVDILRVYTERMPCGSGQANCREVMGWRYGSDLEIYHSQGSGLLTDTTMNGG